jgi:uncharacterized phage infection (PIP) family protein YhgE
MDEPLNSPVVSNGQTPDFGSSFIDAFKAIGADNATPAEKPAVTAAPQKTDNTPPKLSKSEMDIERMFSKKTAAEPAAPAAPDDADIPETIKSTKAADAFRKIKEEKAQLAKQLDELKAGRSTNPQFESQLKTLQEERDALSERVRLLDIERHPDFIKKYEGKITGVFDSVKNLVGTDGERLVSLLKSPDSDYRNSQIDDIVEGLSPSKKAKLGALIVKYDEINGERASELSEAKADYDAVISKYQQDNEEGTKAALESATKTWQKVSSDARSLEIFEPRENDEEWNTELNGRLSLAQQIFNGENSEEDLAKAALWAAAAPKYRELLYAQVEVNKRLQAELSKYRGSEPGVTSKATSGGYRPANANAAKSEDFVASVMKSLGR